MLTHLRARNLGLIADAELDPDAGFTVITGETGAGKTLLLGALRLLLGEQADSSVVGPFADRAQADGVLGLDGELGISRVVPADGRSRSYLDGAIASADALAERVGTAIEVIGQHDQLKLKSASYVLALVDAALDGEGIENKQRYSAAWGALRTLREEAVLIGGSESELARELDLVRHQQREIEAAGFSVGEEAELESAQSRLRHAEELKELFRSSLDAISHMDLKSGELVAALGRIRELDESTASLLETATGIESGVDELRRDLRDSAEALVDDPATLQEIEQRLTTLGELKRKYGRTIGEVLEFVERAALRAEEIESLLGRSASISEEMGRVEAEAESAALVLSDSRKRAAVRLEKTISAHLGELGLETASVQFAFDPVDLGANGADRVTFRFSSHEGLQAGAVASVASGGELSRLILAVSLAGSSDEVATLVFDEVDTGIGGVTALAMGRKLASLADTRQVLCVTHLPQVAAFADAHYVVTRRGDEARLAKVDGPDRLEELARMIAGLPDSDRGQEAAKELLEIAGHS